MNTSLKSPIAPLKWPERYNVPPEPGNGLQRLVRRGKRAFLVYRLKREARQTLASFFRIAEAMGMHPNSQMHSRAQIARLERVNEIAAQLRQLHYGSSR